MDAMGSFGELSVGDVLRALARYRPVAVTVLVILLALTVLPKPDSVPGLAATGGRIETPASASSATTVAGASGVAAGAGVDTSGGDAFSSPVTSGATSFPSFSSGSSFSSSAFPDDSSSGGSGGGSSSSFGPITSGTSTVDTTGPAPEPVPLQIVGSTWASRTGGTPLAKQDVPDGVLPVAFRATDDKRSFVKLAGDGTSLGFAVDAAATRETSGPIKVQACKVTEAWENGEALPLQDAPAFDPNKCVQGTLSASGIWIFDLSSFSDRTDDKGFALVAGTGAGVEWQVAFKR